LLSATTHMGLQGKKIIVGVSGSIAAYKIPVLVRLLVKAGATVKVVTTAAAEKFVTPLTLSTVSKHPVISDVSDGNNWNNHVELGLWADALLIAPCTANTLAKLAQGICDNMLTAVYLSARCPVFVAPAMDVDMWKHPATQRNVAAVQAYGAHIVPVGHGELASGLTGEGRMAEPEQLTECLIAHLTAQQPLRSMNALVTAGPTYEKIDPVRFIGNFSTGKMGIAIAESLAKQGASVTLVLGPTHLTTAHPNITIVRVVSADEMFEHAVNVFPKCDLAVLAAAVADYKPQQTAEQKIKKSGTNLSLELVTNRDILAYLGSVKTNKQTLVGFALETNNEREHALKKLVAKKANMIILNSLSDAGAGFGGDTNKITVLSDKGTAEEFPLLSKAAVADIIVNKIQAYRDAEPLV
jgi:phosphopantothenoylcysteine decarboxylase / phosphopantothenate---cysteine ligase